jgi:hypothetical protein
LTALFRRLKSTCEPVPGSFPIDASFRFAYH